MAVACERSDPPPPPPDDLYGIYVLNEGNFTWSNSSLTVYYPTSGEVEQDVFQRANDYPLGDVGHSMTEVLNDEVAIVMNNSGKVVMADPSTMEAQGEIEGLTSPRFMLGLSVDKAYITDLYASKIWVVNPSTHKITGEIPVHGSTEELLEREGKVFVANPLQQENGLFMTKRNVYVIDAERNRIIDSIEVGVQPQFLVQDRNGKIWVLCQGSSNPEKPASLHCINYETHEVERSFTFPAGEKVSDLAINSGFDRLFFLKNSGVYAMDVNAQALPTTPLYEAPDRNLYALGYHQSLKQLVVSDAKEYQQQGEVMILNEETGAVIDEFPAGIIPGAFFFTE